MDQKYGTTEKMVDFIRSHYIKYLKFPTYQEIADALGLKSKATINCHMIKLEKLGKIVFNGQQYRFNNQWMFGMFREILESEDKK